jgi:hypothetical protein
VTTDPYSAPPGASGASGTPRNTPRGNPFLSYTKAQMSAANDELADAPLAEDAGVWEKRMKAFTLRNKGTTYAQIACELDISEIMARRYVKAVIREIVEIPVDEMVSRQRSVMLDIVRTNYDDATDRRSADRFDAQGVILRCLEHEAKLYGLFAPTRVNLGVNADEFGRQAVDLLKVIGPEPLRELAGITTDAQVRAALDAVAPRPEVIDAEYTTVDAAVGDDGLSDVEPDDSVDAWSNLD